jgi:hypothetical protein
VLSVELTVGSKTLAMAFFIADVEIGYMLMGVYHLLSTNA